MRVVNKLTAAWVNAINRRGLHADGLNLYLQVGPTGSKSWLFRYMIGGKAKVMGLGPVHTVTLAMARDKATDARRKLLEAIDWSKGRPLKLRDPQTEERSMPRSS